MPQAIYNERELVKVYAEQIASVAKREQAGENVQHELEEIIANAVADFGRTAGVNQAEAIQALGERLDDMSTTATPIAKEVFGTAKKIALHKRQDLGDSK